MATRSRHLVLTSLLSLLTLNTSLFAVDPNAREEMTVEEHVSIRSRELNSRMKERIREFRAKEHEESSEKDSSTPFKKASLNWVGEAPQFQLASSRWINPKLDFTSAFGFPIHSHVLIGIADNSRSIELEDGSHWEVPESDLDVLRGWRCNDQLAITPNYSWFAPYDYYITNKSDRESFIHANLVVGPLEYGARSHWIVDIDPIGGHMRLENQMIWCIDPKDFDIFRSWTINDHVIFGNYDSWVSPYTHILINVNMDEHVKARQY